MSGGDHDQLRRELGVYVLGALGPAERSAVEHHLADCASCRDEVASLAALPPLLSRLPAPDGAASPPPFAGVVQRIRAQRRRDRLRERFLMVAAALAVLTAVALVAAPALTPDPPATLSFSDGKNVVAVIEPREWGMAVRITAQALPDRRGYTAFAVRTDGHRAQVASWSNTGDAVVVEGACYLSPGDVDRVEIVAGGDDEVVSVLRPG